MKPSHNNPSRMSRVASVVLRFLWQPRRHAGASRLAASWGTPMAALRSARREHRCRLESGRGGL